MNKEQDLYTPGSNSRPLSKVLEEIPRFPTEDPKPLRLSRTEYHRKMRRACKVIGVRFEIGKPIRVTDSKLEAEGRRMYQLYEANCAIIQARYHVLPATKWESFVEWFQMIPTRLRNVLSKLKTKRKIKRKGNYL